MDVTIRTPTAEELERWMAVGTVMWQEGTFKNVNVSQEAATTQLTSWLNHKNFYIKVAEVDGEPSGFMVGFFQHLWFTTGDNIAHDLLLFVLPHQRGNGVGEKLLGGFVEWAQANNAVKIFLSNSVGINTDASEGLYEKVGGTRVGSLYVIDKEAA